VIAPYERLLALAEREAALVAAEAWDDLAAVAAERAALIARLPAVPPRAARPVLERLSGVQQLLVAALATARAQTAAEIGRLGRGRGAMQGYAVSAGRPAEAAIRLDGIA
jgi:hypothetical protein